VTNITLQSQQIGQGRSTPHTTAIGPLDSQGEGNHPPPPEVIAVRTQQQGRFGLDQARPPARSISRQLARLGRRHHPHAILCRTIPRHNQPNIPPCSSSYRHELRRRHLTPCKTATGRSRMPLQKSTLATTPGDRTRRCRHHAGAGQAHHFGLQLALRTSDTTTAIPMACIE
jgi:hypothetical protein